LSDNAVLLLPAIVAIVSLDVASDAADVQSRCRSYWCYTFQFLVDVMK
jgi:hypothetical protein